MSLLDNVGKKIQDAGKAALKASGDLVQTTKLNLAIKSEENKIQGFMVEIGNTIYEKYKEGKAIDAELSISCEEISNCMKTIEELKQKITDVKNLKKCTNCSAEIDKNDAFCSKCGAKLEE